MLDFQHARIDWIDRNHYTQGTRVAVEEKAVGGEGKVTFEVGEGETALRFKLTESGRFPCIDQKKAADGVILHFDRDRKLRALHLVELKSKVSASKWREIKAQLQGALCTFRVALAKGREQKERVTQPIAPWPTGIEQHRTTALGRIGSCYAHDADPHITALRLGPIHRHAQGAALQPVAQLRPGFFFRPPQNALITRRP